jgi:acyl-CoA reductase-like NAD-dependent aldehyde dehydrogenase
MSSSIARLQASNTDGRARTPRYIQNQLQALHSALLKNGSEIRQATSSSSQHTTAEISIEYHLAISVVKDQYASIDFDQMMDEEYRIANGKDAGDRRVAAGILYIVPSSYTLFYSVVAPLSVAIAAGNCVVLEVSVL